MKSLLRFAFLLSSLSLVATAQNQKLLPIIAGGEFPLYPALARAAQIQGTVKIAVTTDGSRVVATHVESGHPMLVKAAETSAATWRFTKHEPTTFTVTYRFVLSKKHKGDANSPNVTLRFPTEVEILALPRIAVPSK